jgi:putative spermidine/putrescine transport system substrate-binding protein
VFNRRKVLAGLGGGATLAVAGPRLARADTGQIVFTSWGGTTQDAQKQAWADPFTKKTGITVLQDGPTDYGKLKAMIDAGNVTWDVVDVEEDFGTYAGNAGWLEPLDFTVINKDGLDTRFVTDYCVGSFYAVYVLGYSKTAFGSKVPATWVDLFDTTNFPGKRTYYKWSAPGNIEVPLLADGVDPKNLYPLDLDRAFKKLDTIKKDIVWWGSGAQSQQLLASGETPIGVFWNGRLKALQDSGTDVGLSWKQNITACDLLVVPKGTKNKQAAMQFIALASSPEGQAEMAKLSGYAPTNSKSSALLDDATRAALPDRYISDNVPISIKYWAEHRDEIAKRWYAWQAA